jgi:hypothetical protein
MGILKTKQTKLLIEFIRPAKMIHFTTDPFGPFAAFPQNVAQSPSNPAIQIPKRPLVAVLEVFKPAVYG